MLRLDCPQNRRRFVMRPLSRFLSHTLALGLATTALVGCALNDDGNSFEKSDVAQLVEQMSLEEKVVMLHGASKSFDDLGSVGAVGGILGNERLGIPTLRLTDGPAGARNIHYRSTAMPAPVALASSFNTELAREYGRAIGKEARAQQQDVLLSPMTNIVRVPQAGRNFETLGEDPLLAGELVAAEIDGVQDAGLMATVKHYVVNNQETDRMTINTVVGERALREIYLPAFKRAVDKDVAAIMCAYNKVAINGENSDYACANSELLTGILREEWGFEGFVMTDWYAGIPDVFTPNPDPSPDAILAGLDVEMPGGQMLGDLLIQAVQAGDIDESYVDRSVSRILSQYHRFGLLDGSAPARGTIDELASAHAEIAKQAALDGAVLLRNQNGSLPLDAADLQNLLVVGPTGAVLNFGGGGSSRVKPLNTTSPLEALEALAGAQANINYLPGLDLDGVAVPASALADGSGHSGLIRTDGGGNTQVDERLNFVADDALPAGTRLTWSGVLTAPETGEYDIKIQAKNGIARLALGSEGAVASLDTGSFFSSNNSTIATRDGLENASVRVHLSAGEVYPLTVTADAGKVGMLSSELADADGPMQLRMAWETPSQREANFNEAVAAAGSARAVLVFGYNEGTEGLDRDSLTLPYEQDRLISALSEANTNTVVVLNTGDPVTMPWVDKTAAILQMWYPGQEGGYATAELLLGEATPGGKLPVTFPESEKDVPAIAPPNFPGVGGDLVFGEGIYVGYRWYDHQHIEPLFPFGHGLSYTTFSYSNPSITSTDTGYRVSFTVTNTGAVDGTDIPQVYLGAPAAPVVDVAEKALVGFDRVELAAGASQKVTVSIDEQMLKYWSVDDHGWKLLTGQRPVYIGHSSRDYSVAGAITVEQ